MAETSPLRRALQAARAGKHPRGSGSGRPQLARLWFMLPARAFLILFLPIRWAWASACPSPMHPSRSSLHAREATNGRLRRWGGQPTPKAQRIGEKQDQEGAAGSMKPQAEASLRSTLEPSPTRCFPARAAWRCAS